MKTLQIARTICKDIMRLIGPRVYVYMSMLFVANVLMIYEPYVVKKIFEVIELKGEVSDIRFWVFVGLSIFLIGQILEEIHFFGMSREYRRAGVKKMRYYLSALLTKDTDHLQNIPSGELITKIENSVTAEFDIAKSITKRIIQFVVRLGFLIGVLAIYYPPGLLIIPLLFFCGYRVNTLTQQKSQSLSERIDKVVEKMSSSKLKMIQESFVIRINNKQKHELTVFQRHGKELIDIEPQRDLIEDIKRRVMYVLFFVLQYGVYAFLGAQVIRGEFSFSTMIMIGTYVRWFWSPVDILLENLIMINKNTNKYESLQEFLSKPDSVKDGDKIYQYHQGAINLNAIGFTYGNKQLFHNLTMSFEGGKTTALVGGSGSGKSTLVKLIMRLRDPLEGTITVDDQNLRDIKIMSFYDHIAYLTQEPAVFDGTIRENVVYGLDESVDDYNTLGTTKAFPTETNSSVSEDMEQKIWKALEMAELAEKVRGLKDGLNTRIGDRGVKLSGGERQRLGMSRVFYKNPDIIILDEPTSALDSHSEHQITRIMKKLFVGKTVIIIAHRLQTVMHADKIYVLGKADSEYLSVVLQEGTHEQLVKQDGLYKKLLDLQKGLVND